MVGIVLSWALDCDGMNTGTQMRPQYSANHVAPGELKTQDSGGEKHVLSKALHADIP